MVNTSSLDYVLCVPALIIIYLIGISYFNKRPEIRLYGLENKIKNAFALKILSSFLFQLTFLKFYGYGDTNTYFRESSFLLNHFLENLDDFSYLITSNVDDFKEKFFSHIYLTGQDEYYFNSSNIKVIQFTSLISLLTFNNIFITSSLFSAFAFSGLWKMYLIFIKQIESFDNVKLFNYLFFFPSIVFWAGGITKESIVFGCLGWFLFSFFQVIDKKYYIKNFFIIGITAYVIYMIKSYILLLIIPSLIVYLILFTKKNIIKKNSRIILNVFILILLGIFLFLRFDYLINFFKEKIIDNYIVKGDYLRRSISSLSGEDGSSYDLGEIVFSPLGVMSAVPTFLNVTFFRPYIWEINKLIMIPSSIESSVMLFVLIFLIFKVGIFNLLKIIFRSPFLSFCFAFCISFGFLVGFVSGNFGTLVRYKVPVLPFFIFLLFGISSVYKQTKNYKS